MSKPQEFRHGKLSVILGSKKRNVVVRWSKNESFSHWLLKVIVVKCLLDRHFSPDHITLERRVQGGRIDIVAQKDDVSYWIECEPRIDPNSYAKFKQLRKLANKVGFKGESIVVHFYQSYYPKYVLDMPKECECWFADMLGWFPEIFFGIRKTEDRLLILLGSYSKSYTRQCTDLRFRRDYQGFEMLLPPCEAMGLNLVRKDKRR